MIETLKGSCSYCGRDVSTDAEGTPFVLAPMPSRKDGAGWTTFEPVCLMSRDGKRCIDRYVVDQIWRLLDEEQPA